MHTFGDTSSSGRPVPSMLRTGTDNRLPHPPSPNFLLFYHPFQWAVYGEEWLPQLAELRQSPGQSNVGKNGEMSLAIAEKDRQGWKLVPPDIIDGGYVHIHDGKRGAIHTLRWQRPRAVAGTPAKSEFDRAGYYDFLRLVVARFGVRPDRDVVERATHRAENAVEMALQNNGTDSRIYKQAVELRDKMATATAALDAPTPKRRSRAKSKVSA